MNNMMGALRGCCVVEMDSCNNFLSSSHTCRPIIIILRYARLKIKTQKLLLKNLKNPKVGILGFNLLASNESKNRNFRFSRFLIFQVKIFTFFKSKSVILFEFIGVANIL